MDQHVLTLAAAGVSLAGSLASFYLALLLLRVGRAAGDKGLALSSAAMAVFGVALLLESIVNLAAPVCAGGRGRRPQEILSILLNRGTLAAIPLYTVSYALMAASHYVSGVPLAGSGGSSRLYASTPIMVLLFVDYNIIDLIVLAAAAALVMGRYGAARLPSVAFYAILGASHATAALLLTGESLWWAIPVSTMLRGMAPTLLLALTLLGCRRGARQS